MSLYPISFIHIYHPYSHTIDCSIIWIFLRIVCPQILWVIMFIISFI